MDKKRGLLIQAPAGTGKSWFIYDYPQNKCKILDADVVLKEHNVYNRTYYWYPEKGQWDKTSKYRTDVWKVLNAKLEEGYHIMYSGNPLILPTDYIVLIPLKKRIQQRNERRKRASDKQKTEHTPLTDQQLKLIKTEEKVYREFAKTYPKKCFKSFDTLMKHIDC